MRTAFALLFACWLPLAAVAQEATPAAAPARSLNIANKPWTGDLDKLAERRMLRVLVPYSRTLYYNDRGQERGLTADVVREFEAWLNTKYRSGKRPITVYLIPTTRDRLLEGVANGLGDIAAGNLTITPRRLQQVAFAPLSDRKVREIVVTGAKAAPLLSLESLAGRRVHVRPSSSYYDSLAALDERLREQGLAPIELVAVPDALEDEDMMELANAGLIDVLVVDDWKARIWARELPKIVLRKDLVVRDGGQVGWAVRKEAPLLQSAIVQFYDTHARKRASNEYRVAQLEKGSRRLRDPSRASDWQRFEQVQLLFERYGTRYGFDPLMLAAQGYQESRLRQDARSHVGAIGVMQLMPETGASMKVGDVSLVEPNIHAGAKYMDQLMSKYFPDAKFSEGNRPLFAFAAYNAGPGRIARLRREAEARGLDPDKWFNNVELVVAEKVGMETTTYVRNIYKYYVSYKLVLEADAERRRAREALEADAAAG